MSLQKNFKWVLFILTFIMYILMTDVNIILAEDNKDVIRVAFPIQRGFTQVDENGNYSGYTYDYLMEVAQYTNWQYEFVRVEGDLNTQLSKSLDMLMKGEVDLSGAMVYNDSLAEFMNYPGHNYGISYSTLYALNENTEINSSNYTTFDNLKVALMKGSQRYESKLDKFVEMSGINVEKVYIDSPGEQLRVLKDKEVDVLLDVDVSISDRTLRPIAKFSPEPFYFATSKNRTDIVNALDIAISNINEVDPYFATNLHEKYFGMDNSKLYLSEEEIDYIENVGTLKVAMAGNKAPIQYKDKKTGEIKGLSKEVLDYISENTGLKFDIVYTDSIEECNKLIETKSVDLVAGILSYHQKQKYQDYYTTSISYLYSPLVLVVNKSVDPRDLKNKRLALLNDYEYSEDYQGERMYFDTVEERLDAINQGKADYDYGNSYIIQYYLNINNYKNIITLIQPDDLQRVSFGIIKPIDTNLASIINKSIKSIPENELQNFLYTSAFQSNEITFISYIKANPGQTALAILAILMVIISILLSFYAYNSKKLSQKSKLENQRYEQISELSNEFLYEYNILNDKLKLPNKCAQFLGCNKVIEHFSKEFQNFSNKSNSEQGLFKYIASAKEGKEELLFCLPNGNLRWLKVISKTVFDVNEKPIYSVGKIVDIQKEKERQNQLLEKAQKDSLTNVYNSATTRQKISNILDASDNRYTFALFIIDVDYFKKVNDTFGHYTGDFVLIELSNILKSAVRKDDIVGRLGGDEFIVFLKNINPNKKQIISEKGKFICNKVREIPINGETNLISVSIGIALAEPNQDYSELYKKADKALYVVKEKGRNGFFIIDNN